MSGREKRATTVVLLAFGAAIAGSLAVTLVYGHRGSTTEGALFGLRSASSLIVPDALASRFDA